MPSIYAPAIQVSLAPEFKDAELVYLGWGEWRVIWCEPRRRGGPVSDVVSEGREAPGTDFR